MLDSVRRAPPRPPQAQQLLLQRTQPQWVGMHTDQPLHQPLVLVLVLARAQVPAKVQEQGEVQGDPRLLAMPLALVQGSVAAQRMATSHHIQAQQAHKKHLTQYKQAALVLPLVQAHHLWMGSLVQGQQLHVLMVLVAVQPEARAAASVFLAVARLAAATQIMVEARRAELGPVAVVL